MYQSWKWIQRSSLPVLSVSVRWMLELGMKKGLAQGNPRSDRPGSAPAFSESLCCGTNVLKKQGILWKIKLCSQLRTDLVNISECPSVKGHKVYASRIFDTLNSNSLGLGVFSLRLMDGPQGIMGSPESMCVCACSSVFFFLGRKFSRLY